MTWRDWFWDIFGLAGMLILIAWLVKLWFKS